MVSWGLLGSSFLLLLTVDAGKDVFEVSLCVFALFLEVLCVRLGARRNVNVSQT